MLTDHDLVRLRQHAQRADDSVELHGAEVLALIGEIYALRSQIAVTDHFVATRQLQSVGR